MAQPRACRETITGIFQRSPPAARRWGAEGSQRGASVPAVIKLNRARQGCASTQRAVLRLSIIGAPGAHHSQLNGETFEKCAIGPIVW
jgi:hypothetical protein